MAKRVIETRSGGNSGKSKKKGAKKKAAKKATGKKTSRKKAAKKKASKKGPPTNHKGRSRRRDPNVPLVDDPEVQTEVWEGFWDTCTVATAAYRANVSRNTARKIIMADREQMIALIHDLMQRSVNQFEQRRDRGLEIIDQIFDTAQVWINEIEAARQENRSPELYSMSGNQLTVAEAARELSNGQLLGNIIKLAAYAQQFSMQYRLGSAGLEHARGHEGHGAPGSEKEDTALAMAKHLYERGYDVSEIVKTRIEQGPPLQDAQIKQRKGGDE